MSIKEKRDELLKKRNEMMRSLQQGKDKVYKMVTESNMLQKKVLSLPKNQSSSPNNSKDKSKNALYISALQKVTNNGVKSLKGYKPEGAQDLKQI